MTTAAIVAIAGSGTALAAEVTGAADNLRTGWYFDEPSLQPALITTERFKEVFQDRLVGQIYAQPLTANGTLLVVTEENWAYGLDPVTGGVRWEKHFGTAVRAGEGPEATIHCSDLAPRVGITGTPVIDAQGNVAYFVANSYLSGSSGPIGWYLHAVDLASGSELPNFPVQITGGAQNIHSEEINFEPVNQLQRPALLMMNGVVYAAFGSHCDISPWAGWIVGISASSGQVLTKWATTAEHGASIWQSGGGLVSDGPGQILFSTGNDSGEAGAWDPPEGSGQQSPAPEGRLGEALARVEVQPGGELSTKDYFSPFNSALLDEADLDVGSSAPVALPAPYFGSSKTPHLLVQASKAGWVYLLNRDALGGRGASSNNVLQELGPYGGVYGATSVWPGEGGHIAIPAGRLRFFSYSEPAAQATLTETATTPDEGRFGTGSPIVTSNGTTSGSGVLWTTWCPTAGCHNAELRAYNPASAREAKPFWTANIGYATKFSRPGASNGHIYVANREGEVIGFSGPALTPSSGSLVLAAPVGGLVTRDVTLTSTGTEIEVSGVSPPAGPFTATGLPQPGTRLRPGQAVTVSVTFKPSSRGTVSGEFNITTQAGTATIALAGTGEESALQRSEREARERGAAAARAPEPLLRLTRLHVRARASRLRARSRKLAISYTLSGAGTVRVAIYRRVISHRCRRGVRTCGRWLATRLKLNVAARAGSNLLTVNLGKLATGTYRLVAIPVNRSGAAGLASHVDFVTH